ncbi:hypothetical protein [Natrialba sp. SSL1]|uniref:hypothetical protein n=1 Tax=Natrialba sp. SSL1 TaxID=1869245 RepID=UPI0008F82C9E|nr:hypothetical protein [Natrialba sp. SSL1]OIB55780.1 hypothetical protein BBD46_02930 [Natrialba sp. SSL1]
MGVYKIDADYNAEGSVLNNSDDDFPARIQIATRHSFGELRLSRDEYSSVMKLVTEVVDSSEPSECTIKGGRFSINAAPPTTEDTWEIDIQKDRLHYKFPISEGELGGLNDLLRTVHPEYDTPNNPDVEVPA